MPNARRRRVRGRSKAPIPNPNTIIARIVLAPRRPRTKLARGVPAAALRQTNEIIRTNQVDGYEAKPKSNAEVMAAPHIMAAAGDNFQGTSRREAKISIAEGPTEIFDDVKALIESLPAESAMINHQPKIGRDKKSGRVEEEKRNVRVRAWIYAASRENDNDFHLIVGRSPSKSPMYMTMEVSGLPPKSAASYAKIKSARNSYKSYFTDLPGAGYDFYKKPIAVEISGSLFFDITDATGGRPGPEDLRGDMPVIWEVHPVTKLKFEP